MWLNWIRLVALATAAVAVAAPAADGEATPGGNYKPAFGVGLPPTSSEIVADYIRASRSPTPDVAVKRWREFLRKWADDASIEDMTELTLLRQAHFELMRLYYQMGHAREADILLRKADDYAVYSVPEPAKARQWCQTNKFCD